MSNYSIAKERIGMEHERFKRFHVWDFFESIDKLALKRANVNVNVNVNAMSTAVNKR